MLFIRREAAQQWFLAPDRPGAGSPRDHQTGSYQTWSHCGGRGCSQNALCRYCNTHYLLIKKNIADPQETLKHWHRPPILHNLLQSHVAAQLLKAPRQNCFLAISKISHIVQLEGMVRLPTGFMWVGEWHPIYSVLSSDFSASKIKS